MTNIEEKLTKALEKFEEARKQMEEVSRRMNETPRVIDKHLPEITVSREQITATEAFHELVSVKGKTEDDALELFKKVQREVESPESTETREKERAEVQ